jgi:hypothetical protein
LTSIGGRALRLTDSTTPSLAGVVLSVGTSWVLAKFAFKADEPPLEILRREG